MTATMLPSHDHLFRVSMFPSIYFYAHFGIAHKKTLDGNAKMRINSKNAHKKTE